MRRGNFVIDDSVKQEEPEESTSLTLLQRALASDSTAWARIRNLYTPLIYQWCRQAGVCDADVPDVGQDVFAAVAKSLSKFRRARKGGTFRGWLRTITKNKVNDLWRAKAGQRDAEGGSDAHETFSQVPFENDPQDDISNADEIKLLYARAIEIIRSEFADWYAEAFLRIVVQQQNPADVAEDLGKKTSAVYNAKARILKRLRSEFAEVIN